MTAFFHYSALKSIKVIDGDSVRVDIDLGFGITKHRVDVRLQGIDAPETRHSNPKHKAAGIAVEKVVEAWFIMIKALNRPITLVSNDLEDLYGRVIGDFVVSDLPEDYTLDKGSDDGLCSLLIEHNLVQFLDKNGKRRSWTNTKLDSVAANARKLLRRIKAVDVT